MSFIPNNTHLSLFRHHLIEEEKSDATVQKYTRDVARFLAFADGGAITKETVLAYKSALCDAYTIVSANSMLAAINAFFRYLGHGALCVKQFKLQRAPFCPAEKELTQEEYKRLVQTAEAKQNHRLSLLLQTVCSTGIRISELVFITVEAAKRGEAVVNCKGKCRRILLVSALRKKLLSYTKEHRIMTGPIFVSSRGVPLNRSNVWREMKSLCRDAGVSPTKVFPHNLRHLFARAFYGIRQDIARLADVLGHTSINTTRIYVTTSGEEHRRYLEGLRLIL